MNTIETKIETALRNYCDRSYHVGAGGGRTLASSFISASVLLEDGSYLNLEGSIPSNVYGSNGQRLTNLFHHGEAKFSTTTTPLFEVVVV